ncbi:MAG: class I SAM-dependent methyltransferase [Methanoregulaceae archaeon]|jgi:tRNA (cmo5U34)-methyltransferase|nr:class I SAM-dependent methyltransferase [Methanoregulaceae archaeon]
MEHIRDAFDPIAQEYDAQRVHIIPDLGNYYGAAVWAAVAKDNHPEILDIGAGTGLMSALVLEKFPGAKLTLLDISENMLAVARKRFSHRENIRYVVSDYSRSPLGGPYDLVISALSIHHLTSEDKRQLFNGIFAALKPGGMFINADQAEGETLLFRQMYLDYWNDFMKSGPLDEQERLEILRRRDTLDRNEKLSSQLRWLQESGFTDVDVVYKNRTFIVTVARKG